MADTSSVKTSHNEITRLWGSRIASRRRFLGLSQAELARHLDRDVSTVSRIERGLYAPPLKMQLRIAGKLCEDVGYLFPWPNSKRGSAA